MSHFPGGASSSQWLRSYEAGPYSMDKAHFLGISVLLVVVLVGPFLALYCFHKRWDLRQAKQARMAGKSMQAQDFAVKVARYFMPSIRIEKHRFHGLTAKSEPMDIRFESLGLELPNGTTVLSGVTGEFKAGTCCAIMGPSGAGKTTFMNALCGKAFYGKPTGKVFINEREASIADFRPCVGFVPQDDIVHECLTVGEQIQSAALLRGEPWTTSKRAKRITEDVLQILQINHIRNTVVGSVEHRGISGGQRKRVNIGLELAADPTVLFLDEPTSGLDSTSSLTIIESLKKLGELGMTSIMVIHQPRYKLFTLFDEVLLLGKGGRTVYQGPSQGAVPYFQRLGFEIPATENPADWLMDLISGEVRSKIFPQVGTHPADWLFEAWEQNKAQVGSYFSIPRNLWTQQDDRTVLANLVEAEWHQIDVDESGFLSLDELTRLIRQCTGAEPKKNIVQQLLVAMLEVAGRDPDRDGVSREDFIGYLCSMQVAASRADILQLQDTSSSSESGIDVETFVMEATCCTPTGLIREARGFGSHLFVLSHRQLVLWWRKNSERALFLAVVAFAAVLLASMDKYICPTPLWMPDPYLNLHTALALMQTVYCLGLFGDDKQVFWRESASGVSVLAFFISRVVLNTVDLVMQTFVFVALYFMMLQPHVHFGRFFLPFLLVSFVAAGAGYFISSILPVQHGPFVASLVAFVSCGLMGHPMRVIQMMDGGMLEAVMDVISIARWSVGMSFLLIVEDQGLPPIDSIQGQQRLELEVMIPVYKDRGMWQGHGYWNSGILWLLGMAVVLHSAAFLGLKFTSRTKQI
ncbi:unnamed protein product [Polarella glacialis]|uniref:ATP-dependent transporter ycf16 n=1 Tax=Polarella glacialis TaxID=89957 RepID=A0A813IFZ0_POLGL|nr:unnamed protein product [Polarella glacialis]CAE8649717.1 unnamed protein product [Polarella glacialis]